MFGKTIIDLIMELLFICNNYFFFFRIPSILTYTHKERGKKVLKKLTVVYIQKGLILGYTVWRASIQTSLEKNLIMFLIDLRHVW